MDPRGSIPGQGAVMAGRNPGADGLDFFPTPPWATRALVHEILAPRGWADPGMSCWDPACGAGHMARPLAEFFNFVRASDIADYGYGDRRDLDFTGERLQWDWQADWIITNPPFVMAQEFLNSAMHLARVGVALLVRLQWLEGVDRYNTIFGAGRRPVLVCPFAERVAMIEGAYDPDASSATAYAWFVWRRRARTAADDTGVRWIPPGSKACWTRPQDMDFAMPGEAARRRAEKKKTETGTEIATRVQAHESGKGSD